MDWVVAQSLLRKQKINNKNEKDCEYYDKRSSQVLIVISTLWLSSISGAIFFNQVPILKLQFSNCNIDDTATPRHKSPSLPIPHFPGSAPSVAEHGISRLIYYQDQPFQVGQVLRSKIYYNFLKLIEKARKSILRCFGR